MKLPISWLSDYVAIDDRPERLADRLTGAGLEVEAVTTIGSGLEGLIAVEIISVEQHPKADRLKVCLVSDGDTERTVVCGADNFKVGDKAPLAPDGTCLPNGMRIKAARLRGVMSAGMLCAADELGLSDDHTGILILPRDTRPGTPLLEVLGPPETVLTIEVTPNRGDCLSIIGMAREVAALYRLPLRWPDADPVYDPALFSGKSVGVELSDLDGCPRYTARLVAGCRVGPSPVWMQRRLALCGVRPINNIVDVTNYVMIECGQPLHAFDLARLEGGRLEIRRAREGEVLEMLDEACRTLESSMLVIADAAKAVAVAGVMGGEASGISDATSDVVLESAFFTPSDVRRTARRLGVSSEASYRFERGVDPELCEWAGRRAALLLVELSGGRCAPDAIDVGRNRPKTLPVRLRTGKVRSVLGCDVSDDDICAILSALKFEVAPDADGADLLVIPPSFRMDVSIEEDLIEEVARLHGLERIPAPDPFARVIADADDRPVREAIRCRKLLAGMGLREIVNYSFVSHKFLDLFMPDNNAERLVIPYPVSADHAVMRPALIPQMVETLGRNHARQVTEAALFESGRVFWRKQDGEFFEEDRMAVGLMGPVGRPPLDKQRDLTAQEVFLWAKGIAENLVGLQRLRSSQGTKGGLSPMIELAPLEHPFFEAGQAAKLLFDGAELGMLGVLARGIAAEWRFNTPVAVMELVLARLLPPAGQSPAQLKPLPPFPSVRRDLAIVVPRSVSHREVMRIIDETAPPELTSVGLFDIFSGRGIEVGMKSLAYAFVYRAGDRTLTDEDVNRMHLSIRNELIKRLDATVRE